MEGADTPARILKHLHPQSAKIVAESHQKSCLQPALKIGSLYNFSGSGRSD
jgi:hypothetical protein